MAKREDVVYALHAFEAENEDELAFEAGERIIVLERDDQYGDGWYQVCDQLLSSTSRLNCVLIP